MPRTTYRLTDATQVRVESDEDGWELIVETASGATVRVNVHEMASSDALEDDLQRAAEAINDWKAGA